jgi:hypothetical protein
VDSIFESYFRDRLGQIQQQGYLSVPVGNWQNPTVYDGTVREAVDRGRTLEGTGLSGLDRKFVGGRIQAVGSLR